MKIDRLLGIVLLLLRRRKITAPELADYFNVSVRTIYRDIHSIEVAGIPVLSANGVNGGFEILESYSLERQLFSPDDMLSMLNALKSVAALGDERMDSTSKKIMRLLPKETTSSLADELHVELSGWGDVSGNQKRLEQLQQAVAHRHCVHFSYQNGERGFSERDVEPMTLVYKGSGWYLFGYCRLKNDYRLFRLSRMRHCVAQPERFVRRTMRYDEFAKQSHHRTIGAELNLHLRFDREARFMVQDSFAPGQITHLDNGATEVHVSFPEGEWVYSMLLSFGGYVEVISPLPVREKLAAHARRLWELNHCCCGEKSYELRQKGQ
ncbi:MAG: YafY family transcriptional regulator [Deltaproteobacteria bacterium]|nr:YafY family transcriptional regulator [Deltaproteobacteria bacterium]